MFGAQKGLASVGFQFSNYISTNDWRSWCHKCFLA